MVNGAVAIFCALILLVMVVAVLVVGWMWLWQYIFVIEPYSDPEPPGTTAFLFATFTQRPLRASLQV
jgi:hypothetical protein